MSDKKIQTKEDEIDLVELAKYIWLHKIISLKIIGAFFVLGIVIAVTSNVEYKAHCRLLPEAQEDGIPDFGGLGGLAGLAGFELPGLGGSGGLSPALYPAIVKSAPFLSKLIETPIYFEKEDTLTTSFIYFENIERPSLLKVAKEYTVGLPGKIKSIFKSKEVTEIKNYNLVRFSKEEWKIIEEYSDRLSVEVDEETGIISIEAEMPDPVAAAETVSHLVDDLTKRIVEYKIGKAKANLDFVSERFDEASGQYEEKQRQLALFTDRNRNISNSIIQNEYQRLQNEMNIAFEVYQGIASQLEQAKIRVKEETPIFTVLEPVRVPEEKHKPKRMMIVFLSSFFGGIVSIIFIVLKKIISNL